MYNFAGQSSSFQVRFTERVHTKRFFKVLRCASLLTFRKQIMLFISYTMVTEGIIVSLRNKGKWMSWISSSFFFFLAILPLRCLTFLGYKCHKRQIGQPSGLPVTLWQKPRHLGNTLLSTAMHSSCEIQVWTLFGFVKIHSKVLELNIFRTENNFRYQPLHGRDEEINTPRWWFL